MRCSEKPRRRSPTRLTPRTASGLPSTTMYGGTSLPTWLEKPTMVCAPMRMRCSTPHRPPTVAQSPTSTCPASVALLAMVVWWPTVQSCAMCT